MEKVILISHFKGFDSFCIPQMLPGLQMLKAHVYILVKLLCLQSNILIHMHKHKDTM